MASTEEELAAIRTAMANTAEALRDLLRERNRIPVLSENDVRVLIRDELRESGGQWRGNLGSVLGVLGFLVAALALWLTVGG